ncbi:sulfotransferase [Vulcanococcus limneticus]|uniref:tetratricopeptide repeat-containing sulfotransferase family protein n=1 Tax=Vulcanococcus limneticus TaxID=2170428 RepID=UPI00398C1CD7
MIQSGQPRQALPHLQYDWPAAPADAASLAGAALLALGQLKLALPALQAAVAGNSSDPGSDHLNLGRALTLSGRAEEALAPLRAALELVRHDHALGLRSLAEALLELGQGQAALDLLPETSADPQILIARAVTLASVGRHDAAAQLLQEAGTRVSPATPLLLAAADLAQLRGRLAEADRLLRQAIDSDPTNVALWARLAQLGQLGQRGIPSAGARQAADRALALSAEAEPPLRALALTAHAHVLAESGDTAAAEQAWLEALALAPSLVPALSGLGHLLLQQGRLPEALEQFRLLRSTAPLQGWSQLIHARELPDDPAVLEQMERAARQPSLEGRVRTGVLFTLAAAWDRQKQPQRAFALAREANEASKALLVYDPAAHRRSVDAAIARFSQAFLDARRDWGHPSRLPVFVLGMPRSGTTLVEQILAGHSQVHGAGELSQIGELIQRLLAWELHLGSVCGYPDCVSDLTATDLKRHAARLLSGLEALAPRGSARVIDKLPHNFQHIGLIKLLFPNAAIVHLRRDARDIAISNYITDYAAKFGGMGFAYDLRWIGEQLRDHDRLMAHWHRLFPGQILEVPYEDLVDDTEAWARRLLAHLDLDWEPQVLDFQQLERSVRTASVWQVRQPVYTSSKARWRRYAGQLDDLDATLAAPLPADPPPLPLPDAEPGLFGAGMAALQAGQAELARYRFAQLLTHQPQHAAAHHFHGAALALLGDLPAAKEAMRRSVQLHPYQPSWLANLAAIEQTLGDRQAADAWRAQRQQLLESRLEASAR